VLSEGKRGRLKHSLTNIKVQPNELCSITKTCKYEMRRKKKAAQCLRLVFRKKARAASHSLALKRS
jgi:hypothetical protein